MYSSHERVASEKSGPLTWVWEPVQLQSARRILICDRDGTLTRDAGYTYRVEDFEWLPTVVDGLKLAAQHASIVVATNQSGIGRGMFSVDDCAKFHDRMRTEAKLAGVDIAAVVVCPHLPSVMVDRPCDCRKPRPGLVDQVRRCAVSGESWLLVGDKFSDVLAGEAAGIEARLVSEGEFLKVVQDWVS